MTEETGLVPADAGQDEGKRRMPGAMAFYHGDGLIPSYNMARAFAGEGGRIATLPDIWDVRLARLQEKLDLEPGWSRVGAVWDTYYTTASAEYMGRSRRGNLIIIVAHGIGPMRDLDWMVKAYRHQFRDKSRDIRGGRIEREDFLRLESGHYGDVEIVDLKQYMLRYQYPFISDVDIIQMLTDPLLRARLGARWQEYQAAQLSVYRRWYEANEEQELARLVGWGVSDPRPPRVFSVSDNANFSYTSMAEHPEYLEKVTEGGKYAVAHLLSVSGVSAMSYCGSDADYTGVVSDIGLHSWYDGTRFVGIRAGSDLTEIHPGPNDLSRAIRKNWERVGVPAGQGDTAPRERPFYRLDDDREFACYQDDDRKILQSSDPEFKVRGATEVGQAVFTTPIEGYHGFFRYSPKDVRAIAPVEANAFVLGDPEIVWQDGNPEFHSCPVTFFRANVDTRLRIPTEEQVLKDFDLTMELILSE